MRSPLPVILLHVLLLLSSKIELTWALAVLSNSTNLADQSLNVSLPMPQRFQVPGTGMILNFYAFGPRLRYEDGGGLLIAGKKSVDFELSFHGVHERLEGDYWAVDEPPLELAIKALNPRAFPQRGGLEYGDLENAIMGLRTFFPWPWWEPGAMSSGYWGTKFDILVQRGSPENQRVGTGSLSYIDQARKRPAAVAEPAANDDYTSR